MLKFEWNALRVGDKVLVHDPRTPDLALTAGLVAMIDAHKGVHGIGIRVTAPRDGTAVLWPSHLSVHRVPRDATEPCWRCRALADGAAGQFGPGPPVAAHGTGAGLSPEVVPA